MSFLISTPRRDYETQVRRQVARLRMKAPLNRAFKTLKEPSISHLYTAKFHLATHKPRGVLYCFCFVVQPSGLQLLQMPLSCSQFRILYLIGRTHSKMVDSLSGLVRDTLQRIQLTPIVAFSRESFDLARASDSSERGSNTLELVMSARLSDSGIAKLGQQFKTDSHLYLGIGTGCQNMIEAERILMVHFNIHFLCASV